MEEGPQNGEASSSNALTLDGLPVHPSQQTEPTKSNGTNGATPGPIVTINGVQAVESAPSSPLRPSSASSSPTKRNNGRHTIAGSRRSGTPVRGSSASSDDSDTNTINQSMAEIRADRQRRRGATPVKRGNSLRVTVEQADGPQEGSPLTDSESDESNTNDQTSADPHLSAFSQSEVPSPGAVKENSSASEDEGQRGSFFARHSPFKRRNSAQRALREYRKSKLALMQSESDNMERYHRVMRGEVGEAASGEEGKSRRNLDRSDTLDRLHVTDPFSASDATESVDEADTSVRAHDLRLRANGKTEAAQETPLRPPVDPRNDLQSTPFRSPRIIVRRLSTASDLNLFSRASDSEAHKSYSEEEYASVPNSPIFEEGFPKEWLSVVGHNEDTFVITSNRSPNFKVQALPFSDLQTPRRPSKNLEADDSKTADKREGVQEIPHGLSPDQISAKLDELAEAAPPFSLWDYLREEIMASDFDSTQEMKWERVTNFIAIPFWMESIMTFGFFVCLDSFLYTFTILPIRVFVAVYSAIQNLLVWAYGGPRRYLSSSHKCDILKALLIVLSCYILSRLTDASKMYHFVRGQDTIKLYVIFNVLEIADRLCCSFGQDLLDSLFSRSTLARRRDGHQPYLRPLGFFALSLLYVLAHTLVLLYQLVTLNVAINSYDNSLLTLLLSNQFVEIKGSVFKKFEKENLFQLTCADIVERFQLTLMLASIGMRNLIEVSGAVGNSVAAVSRPPAMADALDPNAVVAANASKFTSTLSAIAMITPLPASFTVFPSFSLLETIFTPVCIVLASECLVDWLKHAFITKFNHIRPAVYGRFMDVLCRDLIMAGPVVRSSSSRRRRTLIDQSPVVSRRLGFAAVPLACLLVRMTSQVMGMLHDDSHYDECAVPEWQRTDEEQVPLPLLDDSLLMFAWRTARRPVEFFLGTFSSNPAMTLDWLLQLVWSTAAWILTITIAWMFLVGLKLILGTNLVGYASRRFATMAQREEEEELNARGRQPIGVDREEMVYDDKVRHLIDRREDDATRVGLHGQPVPTPAKPAGRENGGPVKAKAVDSLMDVSRYNMVRSRIW